MVSIKFWRGNFRGRRPGSSALRMLRRLTAVSASSSLLFVPKHWTSNQPCSQGLVGYFQDGGSTRHLGNYPQDPGNEVAIKPEHRLRTWVGKRERFPTNFAIMSQWESYFASLGVVKWLPCELLREKWRQTTKRGVTTTRHERELIFLSFFIFYFK